MKKGLYCTLSAILLTAAVFLLPILNSGYHQESRPKDPGKSDFRIVDKKDEQTSAPDIVIPASDETVTFIVIAEGESFSESVLASRGKYSNLRSFIKSGDFRQYSDQLKKTQAVIKASISRIIPQASFDNCFTYNTVINGFSVRAPYSSREKIRKINGVSAVLLSSEQSAVICDTDEDIQQEEETEISEEEPVLCDVQNFYSMGITGKGKLIAVIDDSFNCLDSAFSENDIVPTINANDISYMLNSAGFNTVSGASVYKNKRIVFAYDYAGKDDDTFYKPDSHGTKIAGICSSIARDAGLILMKVCSNGRKNISDDVLLAAIDDTAKLSPDVINLSFGTPRIISNAEVFDTVYSRLYKLGSYIVSSAGNYSENLRYVPDNGIGAEYTDYSTIAFPSSLPYVMSVGAVNGDVELMSYLTIGKTEISYKPLILSTGEYSVFPDSEEIGYEYITPDDDGNDISERDLKNKILIFKGGTSDFSDIIKKGVDYGAAGVIIITDEELYYDFAAETSGIPAAVISSSDEDIVISEPSGMMSFVKEKKFFKSRNNGKPASFSSYGVTYDLRLKPDVMAVGTGVETTAGTISGTSAASAVVSGIAVLTDEFIEKNIDSPIDRNSLIKALIMNSSEPVMYNEDLYYTPRLQGAGKMETKGITSSEVIVTDEEGQPSASIGDSETGQFEFSIIISSLSKEPVEYDLSAVLQTDMYNGDGKDIRNYLIPESLDDISATEFMYLDEPVSKIELNAEESKEIKVKIIVSEEAMLAYDMLAPNGFYLDGYIVLRDQDEKQIYFPIMGYCGSWNNSELFDSMFYEHNDAPEISNGCFTAVVSFRGSYPDHKLGMNMTTGEFIGDKISIGKNTVKNYYDNGLMGNAFMMPDLYLLRDASDYRITISDSFGKVLFEQDIGTVSAFASDNHDPYIGLLSSFNSDDMKNFFAQISEGEYIYSVSAIPLSAERETVSPQSISYNFTVDNTPPNDVRANVYAKDGRAFLELSAKDKNGIQGFMMYTACRSGDHYFYADSLSDLIEGGYISSDSCKLVNISEESESMIYTYDITELKHQLSRLGIYTRSGVSERPTSEKFFFRAVDYAYNLSSAVMCDTQPSGTVTYRLVDDDGIPVEGAKMSLGSQTAISGENGEAVFEGIYPDLYGVSLLSLPEGCTTDFEVDIVQVTFDSMDHEFDIQIKISDDVKQQIKEKLSSEKAEQQSEVKPEKKDIVVKNKENSDNSFVALIFVSVMLVISSGSLIASRRRKQVYDDISSE